jgi:hypothetical protein
MINLFKKITSPFLVAWGRTPVLWIWRKPRDDLDAMLLTASKHFNPKWKHERFRYLVLVMYIFMLLVWPLRAVLIIFVRMKRYAAKTKKVHKISYRKQFLDQLNIAFLHWTNPEVYYLFELFDHQLIRQARYFLQDHTMTALLGVINSGKSDEHIENKYLYNQTMRARGFPMVNDIALVKQRQILNQEGVETRLPDFDFIIKPSHGVEGKNVQRFERLKDGNYRCSDGQTYDNKALHNHVMALSESETFLVEPRLTNHPEIADLTNKSFGTCRIVTARRRDGSIDIIFAVFKMPTGKGVADNFSAGGIASPVNLATGTIGKAVSMSVLSERFGHHPDTGARIENRQLPFWQETMDIVKSAHLHTEGDFVTLGWDIGVTQNGPIILETQVTWGFIISQRPGMRPLGSTVLPAIYREWI